MSCKYYKNGVESRLYTELFGYMDDTAPASKTVDAVYKILKGNGIATKHKGSIYLTQANVKSSLREVDNINNRYPGLIETEYLKMTYENIYSKSAELHVVTINADVLNNIIAEKSDNADLLYKTQNDIDTYTRTVAGSTSSSRQDTKLAEALRRENTNESRFSDMQREEKDVLTRKSNHLKEAFAKAGIDINVEYDNSLDSLGSISKDKTGDNINIKFNPNLATEDLAYHEFGHAYIDLLGVEDPAVARAFEELRDSDLYNQVADIYPELTGERLDKEVLATAIGIEGAKITRKNPTPLQQLLNRIFRAFSKMLNKFGLQTNPNTASVLAQEMFAQKLRTAYMVNPISNYTQFSKATKDQQKIKDVADDLRVKVRSDIAKVKKLPIAEQEKLLPRLERLKSSLVRIDRVEDFVEFIEATTATMLEARSQFDQITNLLDEKGNIDFKSQSTYKNLNLMYAMKTNLDALDVLKDIKSLVRSKKRGNKILSQGAFDTLEEKLEAVLEEVESLQDDFSEVVIPIIAESLLGFHNKNIDVNLQSLIDNIEDNLKNGVTRITNLKEVSKMPSYKAAKRKLEAKEYTQEEFNRKVADLQIESLKNKMMPNRSALVKQLTEAHTDKSGFSYLMDPMIYSSESALQLFTKALSEANIKANDMTLDFKYKLKSKYDSFAQGHNEFDVAELNEALQEEIEIDVVDDKYFSDKSKKGEVETIKVLSLTQPYRVNDYYSDMRGEYKRLAAKYDKPQRKDFEDYEAFKKGLAKFYDKSNTKGRKYRAEMDAWLSENTEPVEGWSELRDSIQRQIKDAEKIRDNATSSEAANMQELKIKKLRSTLSSNMLGKKPRGEWVKPKLSKYSNPRYEAIQNDPRLKEYYDFVLEEFQKGHKMVGTKRMEKNSWDNISYLMPSIRKEGLDRIKEQGFISAGWDLLADGLSITETDDHLAVYDDATGELQRSIPVRYTNLVESKDVSKDIASSLYRFRHMAHNYVSKSEVVGQVMLFRDIIAERGTLEVNAEGLAYVSAFAEQLGVTMPIKKPGESYTFKHLNEWINMVMFGEQSYKTNVSVFGKSVNLEKSAGALNQYVAINTLSMNLLQGGNQLILDNLTLLQESVAGQFVTKSDLAWATQKYWGEGAALSDVGNFAPDTKLGKALELFDALVEFTDQEGNKIVGSKMRKLLDSGNLMVVQQAVEHELTSKRMLALMKNLEGKLKDKDGKVIMKDGKPANLYDMLIIDKDGRMSVDPSVANFDKSDFIHLLRGLGRRTNQTKGRFDSPILSKSWYGKLFGLFRSWVVPGIRRRYGHGGFTGSTIHTDEELGVVTQGMYVSFANLLAESVMNGVRSPLSVYNGMSTMEQENVKRTLVELSSLISAMALVAALASIDDEDETYLSNFMLYQAKRYETEIKQWTPIVGTKEMFRILKSPSATFRPIEQGASLVEGILNNMMHGVGIPIADKQIFYQRKSGRFKKGDRKIRKDFEDLMPILRGMRTSSSPKEKYKWFLDF